MAVSVRDVAQAAGVSVGTVSNVLNHPDRVTESTVRRVQEVIERLGFVRNDAARQLRAGQSRTIGLVVLDARNPFFADVARGAEDRAHEDGLSLLLANSDDDERRERSHLDLFEQQRAFGVLITPATANLDRIRSLRARGVPAVLVDRNAHGDEFPSVAVDDIEGGRIAAQHLLDQGRRRLAFVGGPLSIRQVSDRLEGAQRAVASHPGATIEVVGTEALTVEQGRVAGRRMLARPPAERADAIFAANDLLALGLMQSLVMNGDARIPDDIALIGYDDIDFAAAAVIPLSSVRQPAGLIGSTAVELLLQVARGETPSEPQVVFQPELVIRASTGGGFR